MSRGRFLIALGIFFGQSALASGQARPAVQQTPKILTVASDTIADVALAVADPEQPVIYYNPRLMALFGPEISAFVLAHELAHIALGHLRPAAGAMRGEERGRFERLLQTWELEADCVAAIRLARERPAALEAAIRFFEGMGNSQFDQEHPTGSARAIRLAACGLTGIGDLSRKGEGPQARWGGIWFR